MKKVTLPFLLQALVFFIPVNIVMLGEWGGAGIQWPLVLFQQTDLGISIISVSQNLLYVFSGIIEGWSAFSLVVWAFASALLLGGFALSLYSLCKPVRNAYKFVSASILISAVLFLISDVAQYGFTLWNQGRFCVPIGIPLLLFIGWVLYHHNHEEAEILEHEIDSSGSQTNLIAGLRTGILRDPRVSELLLLVLISIIVKIIVLCLTVNSVIVFQHIDIDHYYHYAAAVFSGELPYRDFSVEYPQFFFIPVLFAAMPAVLLNAPALFLPTFTGLTILFDVATLICVYLIAARLFGPGKAFLPTLLYATAFASAFFSVLVYDIVPTFFLMLSLTLFLYSKEVPACLSAAAGGLMKWFPGFCLPFYLLYAQKRGGISKELRTGIIAAIIMTGAVIIPFLFLNYSLFIQTYTRHISRVAESHSLIYYLDAVTIFFTGLEPFQHYALILLVVAEITLIFGYYRYFDKREETLCTVIFLSIFLFIICNKIFSSYFIIWVIPFLALLLSRTHMQIILFYSLQLVMFIEAPVLHGVVYAPALRYKIFEGALPSLPFIFYTVKILVFMLILIVIFNELRWNSREACEKPDNY